MVIGQEYSHFWHLSNPPSMGRQVNAFVSMASYPAWRRRVKLLMDLARHVAAKATPWIDSLILSEKTATLSD